MTVYLVGAGPGDPSLLTLRAAELLSRADVVVHDRLVDPSVLALAPAAAEVVDVGKRPGDGEADRRGPPRQEEINRLLVERARTGATVVRLKGGDPFVFGRGGEEAQALTAAGVPWEVVPGVTSALSVPALAGVPVTHRGLATSVTVVSGHAARSTRSGVDWRALARAGGTVVVLMGVAARAAVAQRLMDGGQSPDTPVVVVEWGATERQRQVRTTLAALGATEVSAPAVIVVGAVAALELGMPAPTDGERAPAPGPLRGRRVVVTRAAEQAGTLTTALQAAGARVVELPVLTVADPADGGAALAGAAARVAGFSWVAFTSANAVHRMVPQWRDARALGRCRVAAVGPGTAAALARHHVATDLVPSAVGQPPTAAGLAAAIGPAPERGGAVLFPRAADARPDLPEGLRARGWRVEEVEAYRTEPAPPPGAALQAEAACADAVVFTSPSTVTAYLALTEASRGELAVPPVVACIGPVTAAAVRAAGLAEPAVAADPTVEALVAALAQSFPPPLGPIRPR